MTFTTTISPTSATPEIYRLDLVMRDPVTSPIVIDLSKILFKYQNENWTDNCSQRLLNWGVKLLRPATAIKDIKNCYEIAKVRIPKLLRILENPLKPGFLLQEPYLNGKKRVLEKSDILQKDPPQHTFAHEMLDWIKKYNLNAIATESDKKELVLASATGTAASPAQTEIQNLVALRKKTTCKVRKLQRATQHTQDLTELMDEYEQKLKKTTEESAKALNEKIATKEKTQNETLKVMQHNYEDLSGRFKNEQQARKVMQAQISHLQNEVSILRNKYAQAIASQQNKVEEHERCVIS